MKTESNIFDLYKNSKYYLTQNEGRDHYDFYFLPALRDKKLLILDFGGNEKIFSAAYLNSAFGQLFKTFSKIDILSYIRFINLSENTRIVLDKVLENSEKYYTDETYKNSVDFILAQFDETE